MGFSGVKTIEKAEVCVKKHFPWVKNCGFQDCDIEAINDVIRILLRLKEEYPEAAELIEVIEATEFPTKISHGVPAAHQMAIYDVEERSLLLNTRFYADNSRMADALCEAEHDHLIPYFYPCAAYPVVHAFAHILLEWIASAGQDVTIKGYSGKAIDVLSHYMQPHPFDELVSKTAGMSMDELFAEVFASDGGGFLWHNVRRTMQVVYEVTKQMGRSQE